MSDIEEETSAEDFCNFMKERKKKSNTLVIGPKRTGKSSFLNTCMAAASGEYRERTDVGPSQGAVSNTLRKFEETMYVRRGEPLFLPTFNDLPGFDDDDSNKVTQMLRMACYGILREDHPIEPIIGELLKEYREMNKTSRSKFKMDRVIFVTSAELDVALPQKLMEAVVNVVRKESRAIPLFGVLTHKDKVDETSYEFKKKKNNFRDALQISERKVLVCTNYCDDFFGEHPRSNRTFPEIDEPVLRFLKEVYDWSHSVANDAKDYFDDEHNDTQIDWWTIGAVLSVICASAVAIGGFIKTR